MNDMKISDSVKFVGVNDHKIDLFEGQFSANLCRHNAMAAAESILSYLAHCVGYYQMMNLPFV